MFQRPASCAHIARKVNRAIGAVLCYFASVAALSPLPGDNGPAITAALAAGPVELAAGQFPVQSTITLPPQWRLTGAGPQFSQIVAATPGMTVIAYAGTDSCTNAAGTLADFSVVAPVPGVTGIAIKGSLAPNSLVSALTIDNVGLTLCQNGLDLQNVWSPTISRVIAKACTGNAMSFRMCGQGMLSASVVENGGTDPGAAAITVQGTASDDPRGEGFAISNTYINTVAGMGCVLRDVHFVTVGTSSFTSCAKGALWAVGNTAAVKVTGSDLGCQVGGTAWAVFLDTGTSGVTLADNELFESVGGVYVRGRVHRIIGNMIQGMSNTDVVLDAATDCIVSSNNADSACSLPWSIGEGNPQCKGNLFVGNVVRKGVAVASGASFAANNRKVGGGAA